jgi:glycosyltransferase 2 family protein
MNKNRRVWLGIILSGVALYLAFRQVELAQVYSAFARANYWAVGAAMGIQLLTMLVIAGRWRQLFIIPPKVLNLLRTLLIAQLVNVILPIRLGVLVRAYLVGKEACMSKTLVLGTIVSEKVFDSLAFVLLFVTVLPFVAPDWFNLSALPTSSVIFLALLPVMILITWRRRQLIQLVRALLKYMPGEQRFSLVKRFETILDGLGPLQEGRRILSLWGSTLLIMFLGALVNVAVMRAFGIDVPWVAAFFLLAVLQMGSRIPVPLGGMGVFQYLCVKALSFFGVDANLALSYGFMLHFVVFVPGSLLGALGLYQMHESLSMLKHEAEERV